MLGAIVEAVDGRPIAEYVRDEILSPLALDSTFLGIPVETQADLGARIVPVAWTGHTMPVVDDEGALSMVPYHIENRAQRALAHRQGRARRRYARTRT